MTFMEFDTAMRQLRMAYNKQLEDEQMQFWFEKFKNWPAFKFGRAIDLCIEENDRFPSIASVNKKGYEITDPTVPSGPVSGCERCQAKGHVTALSKDGYKTCFRCFECNNWQGRFSDSIPLWSMTFHLDGYRLV